MEYGAETWILIIEVIHKFKVTMRGTERAILGISLNNKFRNEIIRWKNRSVSQNEPMFTESEIY